MIADLDAVLSSNKVIRFKSADFDGLFGVLPEPVPSVKKKNKKMQELLLQSLSKWQVK